MKLRMSKLSDGCVCLYAKRLVNGQLRMYMATSQPLKEGEKLPREEFKRLASDLLVSMPLAANRLQLAGNG